MRRDVSAWIVVVVVLASLAALWLYAGLHGGPTPLAIDAAEGEVVLQRGGTTRSGTPGTALHPGDRVTTGEAGQAVLSRGGRSAIQLAPRTAVRLVDLDDDVVELELEEGRVRAQVRPDAGAVRLSGEGRRLLATDADFEVARDAEGLQVEVSRGALTVSGVTDVARVEAGQQLQALGDGTSALQPIPEAMLLDVTWPERVREDRLVVHGRTLPGALVLVRGSTEAAPVRAGADGQFRAEITLAPGANRVAVTVRDRFGREARREEVIERDVVGPSFQIDVDFGRPR